MMNAAFAEWLAQHELTEAFTTAAGDALFVNVEKKFGVLKKNGNYNVQSFYLDDVTEIRTYDDEHLLLDWTTATALNVHPRSEHHSSNELYMRLRLKNHFEMKLQIFRAGVKNVPRESNEHVNLCNYAYRLTQTVRDLAIGLPAPPTQP